MTEKKHTNEAIVAAYIEQEFNKSKTAKALGMAYSKFMYLVKKDHELRSKMDEALDSRVDDAEKGLLQLIKENNFPAIKFFLENKGRERGYGNRIEVQTADESAAIIAALGRKYADDL